MMDRFPTIRHIDDVLPHVDDDCFRVIEKDCGHTYINYVKMGNETFPPFEPYGPHAFDDTIDDRNLRAAVRRECRGIAFDTETGLIASRPFHKFFNVGEREDMTIEACRFGEPHVVMDKVDGSMIRPLRVAGGIRWATKMGITDTALIAETWLAEHPKYAEMAEAFMEIGCTPIFEFVSRENRVVVDYGETSAILLAVRANNTGSYLDHDALVKIGRARDIPVVKVYDPVEGDPTIYLDAVRKSDDLDEGIVVAWEDGRRAKVKTETYSTLHKVKEAARTERTLVTAIREETVDDLLPLIPEEDRARVQRFITAYFIWQKDLADDCRFLYEEMRDNYPTKKAFALGTNDGSLTQMERAIVFGMWDGKLEDGAAAAEKIISGGLSSETKWEETKQNVRMSSTLSSFKVTWEGTEVEE